MQNTNNNASREVNSSYILPQIHGKGAIMFTGPDGLRDQRVSVKGPYFQYVGNTEKSSESTDSISYIWRSPKYIPFPLRRSQNIGEIGWSACYFSPYGQCSTDQDMSVTKTELIGQQYFGTIGSRYFGKKNGNSAVQFPYETDSGIGMSSNSYNLSPSAKPFEKRRKLQNAVSSYSAMCRNMYC